MNEMALVFAIRHLIKHVNFLHKLGTIAKQSNQGCALTLVQPFCYGKDVYSPHISKILIDFGCLPYRRL